MPKKTNNHFPNISSRDSEETMGGITPTLYSHRLLHTERLIPPKPVHQNDDKGICEGHDLELGDRNILNPPRDALCDEPHCLTEDDGLGECVAFAPVLDFVLGGQVAEGSIFYLLDDLLSIKWVEWHVVVEEVEATHEDKKSMGCGPFYIVYINIDGISASSSLRCVVPDIPLSFSAEVPSLFISDSPLVFAFSVHHVSVLVC